MKKKTKKLALAKETVRRLGADDAKQIVGGLSILLCHTTDTTADTHELCATITRAPTC